MLIPDRLFSSYRFLMINLLEMFFLDHRELLVLFVNQRNIWRVALKLYLDIDKPNDHLEFDGKIEMVLGMKNELEIPILKIASKGKHYSKSTHKSGFVPFRCVIPLPLYSNVHNRFL